MERIYPIKETVKIITVTKQSQKINFQIRHPENVAALIEIAVSGNKIADPKGADGVNKGNMLGHLSLSIPQKGDVVFGEDVMLDNNDYSEITEKTIFGTTLNISQSKKRQLYFKTCYHIDKAILEGFFQDVYSPNLFDEKGNPLLYLYKIRIYLRYEVKLTGKNTPTT